MYFLIYLFHTLNIGSNTKTNFMEGSPYEAGSRSAG
jgi:hypothetical protein